MKTCKHAKNYKGIRPPKCGCRECNHIFNTAQPRQTEKPKK